MRVAKSSAPKSAPPPLPPIAVFHGPQRFLQLEHTERLRAALCRVHGEVTTVCFDGASASPADILDECRSLSLMQTHKLVVVDNADALLKAADDDDDAPPTRHRGKTARELFETYAESPDSSATLVLRAMTWRPGKLDKAVLASRGTLIKCEELHEHDAAAWAVERAQSTHKTTLEPAAANMLIDALGVDLGRIDCELAKLSLATPGKPITAAQIKQMVGVTREEDFWEIQSSLLSGDPARALGHLRSMLEVSRHDPTPLLFTYCDLARKLHAAARGLAARENPRSLMGRLKLWGPAGDALLHKAGRVSPPAAAKLVDDTVDAMVRQRSGVGDPEHILEGLTLRFVEVCQG